LGLAKRQAGEIMKSLEIVEATKSGGASSRQTIAIPSIEELFSNIVASASTEAYRVAIIEDNLLGKKTVPARETAFSYLRHLYLFDPTSILFRNFRELWQLNDDGHQLLVGLFAAARDAIFRASAGAVLDSHLGDQVTSIDLATAIGREFSNVYSDRTLATIGRNTFSSWEQTGHLVKEAQAKKVRSRPFATPETVAFALLLGHLQGVNGAALFDTIWVKILDQPRSVLMNLAEGASQRSLIEFRHSGGVINVGFTYFSRPIEGQLL
jgi:hypothetical protein